MAANEVFKATVIGVLTHGTAVIFDYGYQDQTGGSLHFDMGTAAGDFQTMVQATLAAALPVSFTFKRYRFACVSGAHVGEIGYVDVTSPVIGTLTVGVELPAEVCISLKRGTGFASRKDRGRVFLGPVMSGLQSTSNPDQVVDIGTILAVAANLGTQGLNTQTANLTPVLVDSTGETTGRRLINASFGSVFVQRKSRRFRSGV